MGAIIIAGVLAATIGLTTAAIVRSAAQDDGGPRHSTLLGTFQQGFEVSWFVPCPRGGSFNRGWVAGGDQRFFDRYDQLRREAGADARMGPVVLARVEAEVRTALPPGQPGFGHLGQGDAELTILRTISMTLGDACPGVAPIAGY